MEKLASGSEILELIETFGQLEWGKFESRLPTIRTNEGAHVEDRSSWPPYTSFRFKDESRELISKISSAIAAYSGRVDWVLLSHDRAPLKGTNWTICPRRYAEAIESASSQGLPVWKYFVQNDPEFGAQAYSDMLVLVEYLKTELHV